MPIVECKTTVTVLLCHISFSIVWHTVIDYTCHLTCIYAKGHKTVNINHSKNEHLWKVYKVFHLWPLDDKFVICVMFTFWA